MLEARGARSVGYRGCRRCPRPRHPNQRCDASKVVNELRFLRQVKGFLTPPTDDKIVIREDNEGTTRMATNRFSSRRTRHVDVKHHIVRDAVESVVQIHYVKSGEQHADVLTKALDVNTFETHMRFLLNSRAGSTTVDLA